MRILADTPDHYVAQLPEDRVAPIEAMRHTLRDNLRTKGPSAGSEATFTNPTQYNAPWNTCTSAKQKPASYP